MKEKKMLCHVGFGIFTSMVLMIAIIKIICSKSTCQIPIKDEVIESECFIGSCKCPVKRGIGRLRRKV